MPLYEYRCASCDDRFEEFRSFSDADHGVSCPACGSEDVKRQLAAFATSTSSASGSRGSGGGSCGGGSRGFT